jgi:hypothetical protein
MQSSPQRNVYDLVGKASGLETNFSRLIKGRQLVGMLVKTNNES